VSGAKAIFDGCVAGGRPQMAENASEGSAVFPSFADRQSSEIENQHIAMDDEPYLKMECTIIMNFMLATDFSTERIEIN
jgi:hypothetical protein